MPTKDGRWMVEVWEYERGWGSMLDSRRYFNNKANADRYVKAYNARNTDSVAPDWYMVAKGPFDTLDKA